MTPSFKVIFCTIILPIIVAIVTNIQCKSIFLCIQVMSVEFALAQKVHKMALPSNRQYLVGLSTVFGDIML